MRITARIAANLSFAEYPAFHHSKGKAVPFRIHLRPHLNESDVQSGQEELTTFSKSRITD